MLEKVGRIPVLLAGLILGGAATYFTTIIIQVERKPSNPLLTANAADYQSFVPYYFEPCGKIMFEGNDPKGLFDFCVRKTITQVRFATGITLTPEDLRDSRVKARWLAVMGGK